MTDFTSELASIESRYSMIRDRVRAVTFGLKNGATTDDSLTNGFWLYGKGGTGKTFTVKNLLRSQNLHCVLLNSDMTAAGLFDLLQEFANSIFVLDDMEQLLQDRKALGFLRSALGGDRKVTKTTKQGKEEFIFRGGIIILSNEPPGDSKSIQALATRMNPTEFNPPKLELIAMIHKIAMNWEGDLSFESRMETFDYFFEYSKTIGAKMLSLRLIESALELRQMWEKGQTENQWKYLLDSLFTGRIMALPLRSKVEPCKVA